MISPIKQSNLNFGAEAVNTSVKFPFKDVKEYSSASEKNTQIYANAQAEPVVQKTSLSDKFNRAKLTAVNALKSINTLFGVSGGMLGGVVKGAAVATGIGFIGKNIKDGQNSITNTLKGMGSDVFNVGKNILKFIPAIVTKAPLDNIKNILKITPNFYTQYLKGHKGIAAIATVAGIGVFALNTLKGKIKANRNNADVDHSVNTGHIKTK